MLQLQIENCDATNAEQITGYLEKSGAVAVTMLDQQDDPILEPEIGSMPLWPCVIINALYDVDTDITKIGLYLTSEYKNLKITSEILPAQDWEKNCLDNFKPQQIGDKLLICPSWLVTNKQDISTLILDPGLAFGTGSHETTFLCLKWLAKNDLTTKTILDFGCGSGILGLAALKLGAKHVTAVDIDEQALIATKNNALTNEIPKNKLTITKPDAQDGSKVDIILANILLKTLILLKHDFLEHLKPQGQIVASGILDNQITELTTAFAPEFEVEEIEHRNEWVMIVFSKVVLHG